MMRTILSIDPGTVTLGVAVWSAKAVHAKKTPRPIDAVAYNLSGTMKGSPFGNALRIGGFVESMIQREEWTVEQIVCEQMEFRSTSQGVAAINDVMNVAFTCGVFAQLAKSIGASYRPAPVSQWKGQLSKPMVAARIIKRWGGVKNVPACMSDSMAPSHDWDAVGIGLWALGFFE